MFLPVFVPHALRDIFRVLMGWSRSKDTDHSISVVGWGTDDKLGFYWQVL